MVVRGGRGGGPRRDDPARAAQGPVRVRRELAPAQLIVALALAVTAAHGRLEGDSYSFALLALAGLWIGVAAAFFFRPQSRDFSTVAWASGLVVAAVAEAQLLDGQPLPILWAAVAAALLLLARELREPRLQLAGLAYGLAAAVPTLVFHAPPIDFVRASDHPATGVPSVVALAVVAGLAAVLAARTEIEVRDELDAHVARLQPLLADRGRWLAAVLGLYALSLSILELAELVGTDDVAANFRGGHTAVSAVWGALGLALLYLGLRRAPALRIAGFVLFGVSLAKLFLYDLSRLSSITRALSFLAVGAVLLLAGFFYQRLGESRAPTGPGSLET